MDRVLELIMELGAKKYRQGKPWKEYNVFVPIYEENQKNGYPFMVLQNEKETRICTVEESLDYLDFTI